MKTAEKLALLGTLYVAQGLPYGFFEQALPVIMREQGVSLKDIGLASLVALPWALKFLWSPLVDGLGWARVGLRRSWILPLQALSVVSLLALSGVDPVAGLTVVLAGVFFVNLLSATQDIATDGLAVTILTPRERGLGNGLQVAGYRVGMIIGGSLLLVVYHRYGWPLVFVSMAAIMALTSVPIALHREAPAAADEGSRAATRGERGAGALLQGVDWRALIDFTRRPGGALWLVVVAGYKLGVHFGTAMLGPLLSDLGLSIEQIGLLKGAAGFIAGLAGALIGGALVNALGRRRALISFGVLQALAVAAFALPVLLPPTSALLYAVVIAEHFASGMATAALFTMMMDISRPEAAGAEYTLQASAVVLTSIAAAALSGFSAQALGYAAHFLLAGGLALLALLPVLIFMSRGSVDPAR